MRSLLLSLNIVIGVSIATLPTSLPAATLSKSTHNKAKKTDRSQAKNKLASGPSDLWERIRAGMKIPHPVASQSLAQAVKPDLVESSDLGNESKPDHSPVVDDTLDTVSSSADANLKIRPIKARPPVNQYTELGQKLLGGSKISKAKIIDCSMPKPVAARPLNTMRNKAEIARINERIKASMEASANTRKHTVILVGGRSNPGPDSTSTSVPLDTPEPLKLAEQSKPIKSANPCSAHPEFQQAQTESVKIVSSPKPVNTQQVLIDERINKFITGYSHNPGFLYSVAQRAQPYLFHIVESLSKHGMPMELALLPIVESAYQPTAQSPKNAAGLWQFIPMTGRDYNLEQSKGYDERLDIPESTQAAIRFLSGLKDHFKGDWLLALAAYNSGQGTVDKAISFNQSQGLPTDYWSLRLPEETQNYVPRLLALARIFAHPGAYGVKLAPIKNEPYFVEVKLGREFDVQYLTQKAIDSVAQLASLTPEQFSTLNPDYLNTTLPKQESYSFLMPERNAKLLKERLISIEKFVSAPVATDDGSINSLVLDTDSKKLLFPGSTLALLNDLVGPQSTLDPAIFPSPLLSLNVQTGKVGSLIDVSKL